MLMPVERIDNAIIEIRGRKVMLSHDLAALYGVTARRLNEQVKRNASRFPPDFMFQLTWEEVETLRSQTVTSNAAATSSIGLLRSQNTVQSWQQACSTPQGPSKSASLWSGPSCG